MNGRSIFRVAGGVAAVVVAACVWVVADERDASNAGTDSPARSAAADSLSRAASRAGSVHGALAVLRAGDVAGEPTAAVISMLELELEAVPASSATDVPPASVEGLCRTIAALDGGDDHAARLEEFFGRGLPSDGLDGLAAARARDGFRPDTARTIAEEFGYLGRERARLRWARRAWSLAPRQVSVAASLMQALLDVDCATLAFAVSTCAVSGTDVRADGGECVAFWRTRATLAGWLASSDEEITAWIRVVAAVPDDSGARARLAHLLPLVGRHAEAFEHAAWLAERDFDGLGDALESKPDDRRRDVVRIALHTVATDAGGSDPLTVVRPLVAGRVACRPDDRAWRELALELALLDLDLEAAVDLLERARDVTPDAGDEVEERLEDLYRRTGRSAELAGLLADRARRDPNDVFALREACSIWVGLGERSRAVELARAVEPAVTDHGVYFTHASLFLSAGVPGVVDRLAARVRVDLSGKDVGVARRELHGLADEPGIGAVLAELDRRHGAFHPRFARRAAAPAMAEPGSARPPRGMRPPRRF